MGPAVCPCYGLGAEACLVAGTVAAGAAVVGAAWNLTAGGGGGDGGRSPGPHPSPWVLLGTGCHRGYVGS